MITRRHLLTSTAMLPVGVALAGCPALNNAVNAVPGVATDIQLIAAALRTVLPTIEALTGLAGGAKNTVTNLIGAISGAAANVSSAAGDGLTAIVQSVGNNVASIAALLSGVTGLPAIVSAAISDVVALLPAVQAAAGAVAAPPMARRFAVAITPEQARVGLQTIVAAR